MHTKYRDASSRLYVIMIRRELPSGGENLYVHKLILFLHST